MSKVEDIRAMLRVVVINLLDMGYSEAEVDDLTKKIFEKLHPEEHATQTEDIQRKEKPELIYLTPDVVFDPIRQHILYRRNLINLSPVEAKLMYTLFANKEEVITYEDIVHSIKETPDAYNYKSTTRNWIHSLRSKLKTIPHAENWICNVKGIGYIFSTN